MESATPRPPESPQDPTGEVRDHAEGLGLDPTGEDSVDRELARIEMAGEETAAGWKPDPHRPISPEVRYLHVSRTIHELISDRNRSVGIFLFVASLLFGGSTALLSAPEGVRPVIPLASIQYWCLPVASTTLAIIGGFVSLILIRARIGLIYEVTKLNALLGLPAKRVERVNVLSIFYLMHALVALLGGGSAGFTAGALAWRAGTGRDWSIGSGIVVGLLYVVAFQIIYYVTILRATTETKLRGARP